MPAPSVDSDRSSVSGRSSTSRASRSSKRGGKKSMVLQPPPEPLEERKMSFTPSMLSAGLSQLGRTADGLKPAYLTLTLTGTDLATADPLVAYQHLQCLHLADNRLVEIRGLGALRNLTLLDVSGNKLTQVLDLRLGPDGSGPTNLRSADFSRNCLDMLRDLSAFSRLTHLSVANNRIERVGSGLMALGMLKVLDLSSNRLVSCRGLEGLRCLRELHLDNNCLASLELIAGLSTLQVLTASHNRLRQLAGVGSLSALRTLDVSYNLLGRLEELVAVRGAPLLGALDIRGNPLDRAMSLRLHVVHLLPQVIQLDGVAVDSKEKVLAANMHGADAEGLRLIRRKYFPNGELLDGGGAIPPLAAGLVASAAEEECAADGSDRSTLLRLDAWAASVRPESVLASGGSLVTLADQLASVCAPPKPATSAAAAAAAGSAGTLLASTASRSGGGGRTSLAAAVAAGTAAAAGSDPQPQLQRARVCWRWVVTHVAPTARLETTWDVDTPLFGTSPQALAAERALLGDRPPSPPPGPTPTPGASPQSIPASSPGPGATRASATTPPSGSAAAAVLQGRTSATASTPPGGSNRASFTSIATPPAAAAGGRASGIASATTPPGGATRASFTSTTPSAAIAAAAAAAFGSRGSGSLSPQTLGGAGSGGAGRPPAIAPPPGPPGCGTWAERVARLFTLLCRACELDAVPIPGYWKHAGLAPGERVAAHNHCWAGVKVNGRWRLVDPAAAALAGGHGVPFYVPPEAFIYSYWPLEAAWQLLGEPLSQETWWALPYASLAFFSQGCQLGDETLEAVNVLPAVREGGVLPAFQLHLAAPRSKGVTLQHRLREAGSGRLVAEWPPKEPGVPAYAFQQVIACKRGLLEVRFGPERHLARRHQLWSSLPCPGEYQLEVVRVAELGGPGGGVRLAVAGWPAPGGLRLRVVEEELLLRVKVVLPPIAPHDAEEDGILHSPAVLRTPLPYASAFFTDSGCQLVTPSPHHPLEADRSEPFNVVVPGASRVGLMAEGLHHPIELPPVDEESATFATSLQVPRAPSATLMAYVHNPELATCAWVPLLQLKILPQSQHIVFTPTPIELPEVDPGDPYAYHARDIFKTLDKDLDGLVTRREILTAFRRNRQHADILKCPPRIRQHDGTFERFVEVFLQIDTNKGGFFSFNELAAYMGVLPSGMYESTEEEDEYDSGVEGEAQPEDEQEEGDGGGEAAGSAH